VKKEEVPPDFFFPFYLVVAVFHVAAGVFTGVFRIRALGIRTFGIRAFAGRIAVVLTLVVCVVHVVCIVCVICHNEVPPKR